MTLCVYKDGVLAADTVATRCNSRERNFKLHTLHAGAVAEIHVACAGYIDAINQWVKTLERQLAECDTEPRVKELFATAQIESILGHRSACEALIMVSFQDGSRDVFTMSNFDNATGTLIPVENTFECIGNDYAVISAIAVNEAAPHLSASEIIETVARVSSGCDTKFGVTKIDRS